MTEREIETNDAMWRWGMGRWNGSFTRSAQGWVAHGGPIGSGVGCSLGWWQWRMGRRSGMGLLLPEWDEQSTHCRVEETRMAIWPAWSWVRQRDLSLSLFARLWVLLSLFTRLRKWFEVKITTKNILRPVALILQSTLKTFSVWPNFQ